MGTKKLNVSILVACTFKKNCLRTFKKELPPALSKKNCRQPVVRQAETETGNFIFSLFAKAEKGEWVAKTR
jgi:hypothetical protein